MTHSVATHRVNVLQPWRSLRVLTHLITLMHLARSASRTFLPICRHRMSCRAHRRGDGLVGMPSTLVCTTPSAEGVIWSCNQTHDLRSVGAPSAGVHACASCTADVQRCTHCNVVTETAVTDYCLYAMHAYCAHVNTRTLGPPGSHTLYSSQPCSCA